MRNDGPTVRRLTDFAQVEKLFRSRMRKDFAREELKPLSAMRRLWETGAYDCYGLFAGKRILGYAFLVRLGRNRLLDYFAIADGHRCQGLGSIFLQHLAGSLADADCILVEAEDPDKAPDEQAGMLRERRIRFYQRNGFLKTGLTSEVFGTGYRILEASPSAPHTAGQLRAVYCELYRHMLPARFYRTRFSVSQP